jgi:hypothetical protein
MRYHDTIDNKLLLELYKDEFEYDDKSNIALVYNYVPKFILLSIALTMQKKLHLIGEKEKDNQIEDIWKIWEQNNMQTLKYKIALHYFLFKEVNLEAVWEGEDKITGTRIILHDPDSVKIEKLGDQIIKVTINSKELDENGKTVNIKKILTRNTISIQRGEENPEIKDNLYDSIPFVHIENSNYRIKSLIRLQDTENRYEGYLDALFDLHADPILFDDLGEAFRAKELKKETSIKISNDKTKIRKFLHYPRDSKGASMLESNGAMAQRIQEQQDKIWDKIKRLYPEIVLMEMLQSSGNITGVGLDKKLIEITTSINYARGEIKNALEELNELIGWLVNNNKSKTQIDFEDIIPKSFNDIIQEVSKATGLLSKDWQLNRLENNGIINSAEEELKKQKKEVQANPMGW